MKKYHSFLVVALLLSLFSHLSAQKAKLGDLKVYTKYLEMPSIGLDSSINSFSLKFKMNEAFLTYHTYKMEWFRKKMVLPGYPELEFAGDVTIEVVIGNVEMASLKKQIDNIKPKKGSPYKEYYFEIPYKHKHGYSIINRKDNKVIYKNFFDSNAQDSYTSPKYRSIKEANKWWDKNKSGLYDRIRKNEIDANLSAMSRDLRYKFGFTERKERIKLKRLKSKKHPQYGDYLKINEIEENAFNNKSDFYSTEEFRNAIKPAIDFWIENEPKYDGNDKYEKKLKYACQLNLARIYFWMDEFEKAKEYAEKVKNGNYKAKYGRKFIKTINKKIAELAKVHRTKMHFTIIPDKDDIILEKEFAEEQKAKIEAGDARSYPGFNKQLAVGANSIVKKITLYVKKGEIIDGYAVYEPLPNDTVPNFIMPSHIKVGYIKNDSLKRGVMNYSKIDSFSLGNKLFELRNGKVILWKVSDQQNNLLVNVIKDFKKTQLVEAYTSGILRKSNSFKHSSKLLIYNKSSGDFFNIDEVSFLFSFPKLLYFALKKDCPKFAKKVKETKSSKDYIAEAIKVLEEYDNCKE